MSDDTYALDVEFLNQHADVVELAPPGGGRIAVTPDYQGRVMTSATGDGDGASFGWVNRPFIAAGAFVLVAYNLELFGGRFHSDFWFAAGWGAFPAATGYFGGQKEVVLEETDEYVILRDKMGRRKKLCKGSWPEGMLIAL